MKFIYSNSGTDPIWVGDICILPSKSVEFFQRNRSFEGALRDGLLTLTISEDSKDPKDSKEPENPNLTSPEGFTVSFDKGSHGSLCAAIEDVQLGATVKLPTPDQTDDFGFFGWFTQRGGKGDQYTDETPVTENIILYPLWKKYWTVFFDKNEGTGEMADVKVIKGGKYTAPACGFTAPEGKVFDTWMDGETAVAVDEEITVATDIILKATWKDA